MSASMYIWDRINLRKYPFWEISLFGKFSPSTAIDRSYLFLLYLIPRSQSWYQYYLKAEGRFHAFTASSQVLVQPKKDHCKIHIFPMSSVLHLPSNNRHKTRLARRRVTRVFCITGRTGSLEVGLCLILTIPNRWYIPSMPPGSATPRAVSLHF